MAITTEERIRGFLLRVKKEEMEARARILRQLTQRFQCDCRFVVPWQKPGEAEETEDVDDYKDPNPYNADSNHFF